MNSNQTLYDIIDVVERIRLADRTIAEKEAVVAEATAAAATEVGYKKTIANCRLREATTALDAATAEYNELSASIPAPDELLCGSTIRLIADLRIKRGDLLRVVETQRQLLDAEEAKQKSGAWRPKGAPVPPAILAAQARLADVNLAVARVDAEIATWMKTVSAEEKARSEKRAFDAWMEDEAGDVQPPNCVIQRIRASNDEIAAGSARLEFITPAVMARRAAERRAAAEEAARIAAEEAVWQAEEMAWKRREARAAAATKELFNSLIAINKRKVALAAESPQLIVTEVA